MEGYEYLYTCCEVCNLTMLMDSFDYTNHEEYGIICYDCLNYLNK